MTAPPDERVAHGRASRAGAHDERRVLASVMSRPELLDSRQWAFCVGLSERSDAPFDEMEKIRLGKLQRKLRRMTNDD
jgi:hypothetical protein